MSSFPSIRIEGGLLGPELLDQIVTGEISGQKPADFQLDRSRNLTDEIAAAFADAHTFWGVFKNRLARLDEDDPATTLTRDQWTLPFLALLGYQVRYNPRAYEVDGQTFAVSHRAGEAEDSPPVHIVGARQELGRVPATGRPRLAPHSLVQEYLNRTEHLWGIVTNGLTLRLLRDSTFIRRQAYVEFDLQAILDEQRFHDFAALYRLLHRTRLPLTPAKASQCWLEQYHSQSIEQGGRVREHLREGVEQCLICLGNGFLDHPHNHDLRQKIRSSRLTPEQFYRQLLRLVYRFLFLLVSEDRGLISPNPVYREHYSITRLRRLLEVRAAWTDHDDLWLSLRVLWKLLSDDTPQPTLDGQALASPLEVPLLNGELFAELTLDHCRITNHNLLLALWRLVYYQEKPTAPPRRVNYAALDVEELGSVYESLLDFHPQVSLDPAAAPAFDLIPGSERKTTGSFYTPPELVHELVESALLPVVRHRIEGAKRMANGEWRMVQEPFRTAFRNYANQRLSRSGGLAEGTHSGQSGISLDQGVPEGGTVRHDLANPAGGGIHSGEHRGGMGTSLHGGVHPVSTQGQRQPDGTRNPSDDLRGLGAVPGGSSPAAAGGTADPGQTNPDAGAKPTEASDEQQIAYGGSIHSPFATHHSPSADEVARFWRSTPFAIRHSLLAAHALLSLRILDPACGSGHMLLAAARCLGKELARLRTGEDEPAPERVREATRDVISHCIYGVDKNPLAVDLCRVALWLESHTPGKPLTFLDHRIRGGDSLVGVFDLAVLKNGIPDKAFDPCEGDDKTAARAASRQNKEERLGAQDLFAVRDSHQADALARHNRELDAIPDDSPELIRRKKQLFEASHRDPAWLRQKQACDLWTAAFFQNLVSGESRMTNGGESVAPHSPLATRHSPIITTTALADHLAGRPIDARLHGSAFALSSRQPFFHWPLEFPEVFAPASSELRIATGGDTAASDHSLSATHHSPGFDVTLSNPPWERIKLQEQEFFAARDPAIARAPNKAARKRLIDALPQTNPDLHAEFTAAVHAADCLSKFLRHSGRCPLTGRGDINTYAVFAETIRRLLAPGGRAGIVLPTGIATDDTNKHFFADLADKGELVSLFDFENREGLFPAVDSRFKFVALTLRGADPSPLAAHHSPNADFAFFLTRAEQLNDPRRRFTLSAEDLALFNPNTRTCPVFRTRPDAELTRAIYQRVPVLMREKAPEGNPWGISFLRMFDMSNDSHLFRNAPGEGLLPLYEAKLMHQFDHRFATYEAEDRTRETTPEEKTDPAFRVTPRYWVPEAEVLDRLAPPTEEEREALAGGKLEPAELTKRQRARAPQWLLGFRDITNATNERTAIFSFFPQTGVGNNAPLLLNTASAELQLCLVGNLNAFVLDFCARQKIGGTHMNFFLVQQLPVLPPSFYRPADVAWVGARVLELVYTAEDLRPLFEAVRMANGEWRVGADHSPLATRHSPFEWNEDRRAGLRAELDAWFARAYGLSRKQLRYILDPADLTPRELENILDPWEEVADPLDPAGYAARTAKSDFPGETFRVLKEKELARYGEYRTRRLVLEAWDALEKTGRL